jgi:ABC-type Mn2+/Zn2+ transport systems, permease components
MEQTNSGLQLRPASDSNVLKNRQEFICLCCAIAALLALAALLLWPAAQEGVALLCNMIFDASEAVNSYAYNRFAVSPAASSAAAIVLLGIIAAAVCCVAVLRKSRVVALLFMMLLAGAEIYFGITPPAFIHALLFVLAGLLLLQKTDLRTAAVYLSAFLALFLIVSALAPGVNAQLEAASEHMRDRLDHVEQLLRTGNQVQWPEETQKARRENRLSERDVIENEEESQGYRDYQRQQELEQELSRPKRNEYLALVLMFLRIMALLLLPFAPFMLLDSRKRKALKRRAVFRSANCSEAICAMFLHMVAYLENGGLAVGNKQFSDCRADVAAALTEDYAESYALAVALWQEAAYSDHPMTTEQRQKTQELLEQTEEIVYSGADRKTRFKLKYIACLHA